MIKEMANFVEPYLPPGFRTRLQGRGVDAGSVSIPSPAAPAAPAAPTAPAAPPPDDAKPETKPPQ
jgi:hypothetical protein